MSLFPGDQLSLASRVYLPACKIPYIQSGDPIGNLQQQIRVAKGANSTHLRHTNNTGKSPGTIPSPSKSDATFRNLLL